MPLPLSVAPELASLAYLGVALFIVGIIIGLWLVYGRGLRLNRSFQKIQRLLAEKNWQEAFAEAQQLQVLGCLSPVWQGRARHAQGECQRLAGESALQGRHFEEALEHLQTAARLLDSEETDCPDRVVAEMLKQLRQVFANGRPEQEKLTDNGTQLSSLAIPELVGRILRVTAQCPEALFWEGLHHLREDRFDTALTRLHEACAAENILDPPLYLGALLLREGRTQEALRYLADANRIAPDCPLVAWQLGMAMVAEGGAENLAIRPLQKGIKGLSPWTKAPQKIWQEALPDTSYIARLAAEMNYVCPVFGSDVTAMVRQGQIALAQAQYRLGHFQESADLYDSVLQESPPSLAVLRGLGLSLAKLEQYDDAFKHLRAAHEWQFSRSPKASTDGENSDHLTAGYLAICGAKGKTSRPEDKPSNVLWAFRLLAKFEIRGDPEWAHIYSLVLAEGRALGLPLPIPELVRCCNVFASIEAVDTTAAALAYYDLAKSSPGAVRPEHGWLYCRAAQQHGIQHADDLILFRRGFSEEPSARAFYEKRGWNFDEVEWLFLARYASALGTDATASPELLKLPDYLSSKIEPFLLERAKKKEQAGLAEEAVASLEVLLKLSPRSAAAHDRLACLRYQRGEFEQAANLLANWHRLYPQDYRPLLRRASVEQRLGNVEACLEAIQQAMSLTQGRTRAAIAFLGGRLALTFQKVEAARKLMNECLQDDPSHPTALWCSAAIRYLLGDRLGLANLVKQMDRSEFTDPRFHYLAAVSHFLAEDYVGTIQACERAAELTSEQADGGKLMMAECLYLKGLAHRHQQDIPAASVELEKAVSRAPEAPSANHARGWLGKIRYSRGAYEEAGEWWQIIDEEKRTQWKLDDLLRGVVYLSGLVALKDGRFAQAASFFRDGQHLPSSDLPDLRIAALVMAGRKALLATEAKDSSAEISEADRSHHSDPQAAVQCFEEALRAGCQEASVSYLLGLAYKRQGNLRAARQALQKIAHLDADASFQMGILSLQERRLAWAEQEFERAWQLRADFFEAAHNLFFIRLSRGQIDSAVAIIPRVIELATDLQLKRQLSQLELVLRGMNRGNGNARLHPTWGDLMPEDEEWFLKLARNLGNPEIARELLTTLSDSRPDSGRLRDALLETVLIQAKHHLDRCDWRAAEKLLSPWIEEKEKAPVATRIGLLNLFGCCSCLGQDYQTGRNYFSGAGFLAGTDARLYQNLAIAYEWQGQIAQAEGSWNRYLELLDSRMPAPPSSSGYPARLAFECLNRLATHHGERGQWPEALACLQRALQFRPDDLETLEKLFHLLNQLKRPEDARETLRRLQGLGTDEPRVKLFELELVTLNNLDNVNRVVSEVERIVEKYPKDEWVENRTSQLLANVIACLQRLNRQVFAQKTKAASRLHRLPRYKSEWPEMQRYLRDLRSRLQMIRKLTEKCLPLAQGERQRRELNALVQQIDMEIEDRRSLLLKNEF
jgi:tetratricopeptide (TPR) repeat protein